MSKNPTIYGLIGFPVKHSLSPAMHNAAFKKLGIDAEYKLFEIKPDELEDFLLSPEKEIKDTNGKIFRARDIIGFNITIPHKVRAKEILEKKYPFPGFGEDIALDYAQLVGSINTVKREGGRIRYWNSDAGGFAKSLKEDLKFDLTNDKKALVVGCGGAGRAIIACLSWENKGINKIYAYDINSDIIKNTRDYFFKFPQVRDKIEFISNEKIPDVISTCNLLVNASPVGMKEGDGSIIDSKLLRKDLYVYDVVYNRETQLIKDAKSLGASVVGGLGMLLYQGVLAFNFWTGEYPPIDVMRKALMEGLNNAGNHK